MSIERKSFQPQASQPVWNRLSMILPSVYDNTMSFYEALQAELDCINDVQLHFNELVDWVNGRDTELTDYVNQQIEDFTNANNAFYQKIDNLVQQFMSNVNADIEQFKQDIRNEFNAFTTEITNKFDRFTQEITTKFEELSKKFADLKTDYEQFKTDLTQAFENFKNQIQEIINNLNRDWETYKGDLERWKLETFNYLLGEFDGLKAYILSKLPETVESLLPEVLRSIAGVGLKYNEATKKIDVNYGSGLAIDGEGKLIVVGGGGDSGGVTAGDTVVAGDGINVTAQDGSKVVSLKVGSADSIGGFKVGSGLEVTPDGTLNATGGGGTGGDVIQAGEGIEISGTALKTVSVAKATASTLGGVKTGDPLDTGLSMDEDGTIRLHGWTPIDVSADFTWFTENLEPVNQLWTIDCGYKPRGYSSKIYCKMSETALSSLGLPQDVSVVWNPDFDWQYNSRPNVEKYTQELVGSQNFRIRVYWDGQQHCRNGSGKIVCTWTGKENVASIDFKVVNANIVFDAETPILIDGTPMRNGDTVTFSTYQSKNVGFKLADGTIISDMSKICAGNVSGLLSCFSTQTTNNCGNFSGLSQIVLSPIDYRSGTVTLGCNTYALGNENGVNDKGNPLITLNVEYAPQIWDGILITKNFETDVTGYVFDQYTVSVTMPNYRGSRFKLTTSDSAIVGVGETGSGVRAIDNGGTLNLYPCRDGFVTLTLTTDEYTSSLDKKINVNVTEPEIPPHVKITTDANTVENTGIDIANPATVTPQNLTRLSKAQGEINLWVSGYPTGAQIFRDGTVNIYKNQERIYEQWGRDMYDPRVQYLNMSTFSVGDKLSVEYTGNMFIGAYKFEFAEVVE